MNSIHDIHWIKCSFRKFKQYTLTNSLIFVNEFYNSFIIHCFNKYMYQAILTSESLGKLHAIKGGEISHC